MASSKSILLVLFSFLILLVDTQNLQAATATQRLAGLAVRARTVLTDTTRRRLATAAPAPAVTARRASQTSRTAARWGIQQPRQSALIQRVTSKNPRHHQSSNLFGARGVSTSNQAGSSARQGSQSSPPPSKGVEATPPNTSSRASLYPDTPPDDGTVLTIVMDSRDGAQIGTMPHLEASTRHHLAQEAARLGIPAESVSFTSGRLKNMDFPEQVIGEIPPQFPVLVMHPKYIQKAKWSGADEVSIVTTADLPFAKQNLGLANQQAIARQLHDFSREVANRQMTIRRIYVSASIRSNGNPLQESPELIERTADYIAELTQRYKKARIVIGETSGLATPAEVRQLFQKLQDKGVDIRKRIAFHPHDAPGLNGAPGNGAANARVAIKEYEVREIDCSLWPIGGCPAAQSAMKQAGQPAPTLKNLQYGDLLTVLQELKLRPSLEPAVAEQFKATLGDAFREAAKKQGVTLNF